MHLVKYRELLTVSATCIIVVSLDTQAKMVRDARSNKINN